MLFLPIPIFVIGKLCSFYYNFFFSDFFGAFHLEYVEDGANFSLIKQPKKHTKKICKDCFQPDFCSVFQLDINLEMMCNFLRFFLEFFYFHHRSLFCSSYSYVLFFFFWIYILKKDSFYLEIWFDVYFNHVENMSEFKFWVQRLTIDNMKFQKSLM